MNNKDFEEFFKDLDPIDEPNKKTAPADSFFEDATSSAVKKEETKQTPKADFEFEDEVFAPPPPEEEEQIVFKSEPVREKEKPKAKKDSAKTAKKPVDEESLRRKKKKRLNTAYNWLLTVIWVASVLAVSVFIASFALSSINDLVGFSKESKEVEITIPEGYGLSQIAELLEKNGIIDEPFTFEVYARVKDMETKLAPGTYVLNSNLGYDQIFQALKTKEKPKNVVTVNFYEGMDIREIAERLEEYGVCGYDEFIEAVNTETFEYEFESMMGTDENIYFKWEGYLFPDTYEFYTDSTPRSVIAKFIDNFNNKFTSEFYLRMQELGMTLEEVITLASVIQSEAAYMEDMQLVSSAFHNRLAKPGNFPHLESDVTWFYYEKNIMPFVDDEALSDSYHLSYDTYFKEGLPVGPICNPGLNAIKAALYPAETDYYFFVTDHNGKFYYASTMAEHEANIVKAGRG